MEKKLTKHGNSVALILDKALLKLLGMDESTIVTIAIKGNSVLITPTKKKTKSVKKTNDDEKMVDDLIEEYSETLKKLAKT